MAKKKRRIFTDAQKNQAVEDYVSGKKSAAQVAADLAVAPDQVYKWKIAKVGRSRDIAIDELEQASSRPENVQRIQNLKRELREFKLMLAEKPVIEELLKKRLRSANSQQRSELYSSESKPWSLRHKKESVQSDGVGRVNLLRRPEVLL